ncbi:hypothetical protein DBR09_08780 [Aeromonas sp. HMWF016]|nr:hypothetical protein DBR09_08780 [Aeromonas sp. HMWF016]
MPKNELSTLPTRVYRSDLRSPDEVFNNGMPISGTDDDIYRHVNGSSCKKGTSAFLATSDNLEFLKKHWAKDGLLMSKQDLIYIYEIIPDARFFNAYHSLSYTSKKNKDSSLQSTAERFKHQGEWLAKGGVSAGNIVSAEVYGRTDKGNDIVFIKKVENSNVTATPSANAYPYQYKSSKDKTGSLLSCFGYGKKEPKEQYAAGGISPHCIPCEKNNCWIEIDVRDEHNQSFQGLKATLTDATGTTKTVTLQNGPTLVEGFAVGPVTVKLETKPWLKAVQSRETLKEGETSQVPAYTDKLFGHDDVKREHVKVTTGDLCLTDPEQPLAEGHKAGQAQPPRFITKHSYVIEVKGYQLNILRIGVFFDGTANNTFKHREGKSALETALAQCSPEEQQVLLEQCFEGALPDGLNNSEKNDITNIGKARDLYKLPTKSELNVAVYVEGIGTVEGQDDAKTGLAADKGDTSSAVRVEQACQTQIVAEVKKQLERILPTIECINKVEFDVFGFSRGASAARQFVNRIDKKGDHPLVDAMAADPDIPLKAGFDWASRDNVRIQFVGLFDTVVSSYLWGKRNVTLAADCAERVVHIVAADEWRYHFDLTRITDDAAGTAIAKNFTEVIIPGAHSDIGGGYYSRWSLRDPNGASPLITENCVIATFNSDAMPYVNPTDTQAYRDALAYAKMRAGQGWVKGVVPLANHRDTTQLGYLNVRPRPLGPITGSQSGGHRNISIDVVLYRVVEGEYSRIPLHMMVEAARDAGVPFIEWDPTRRDLIMDSALSCPTMNLAKLDELWVDVAKRRGEVINLARGLPDEEYQKLRQHYAHYSADTGLVNKPNRVGDQEVRKLTGNKKGGY